MEWRDEGVVLAARTFGETSAVAEIFTTAHGRHAGVVRGGAGRRMAPVLQPGTQVAASWRARLDDQLGTFTLEPLRPRVALLSDAGRLAALGSVCAVLCAALPERAPHPALWTPTVALLDRLDAGEDWALAYLRWELGLLDDLGFGLDLSACAVTGTTDDLAYVSPRTGRAVARAAAGAWAPRLLPLPPCLTGVGGPVSATDIDAGLALTAHFLLRALPHGPHGPRLPEARTRLALRMK